MTMRNPTKLIIMWSNIKPNLPLIAFAIALGSCIQQIMWSAMHLSTPQTPQSSNPKDYDDHERTLKQFTRLKDPPKEIYVLGERNSGTNYAASILRQAFDPPNTVVAARKHEFFSADIPVLKHKHMLRHSLLDEEELSEISKRTDILWILAVRNPCDWAESMKRMPWHMCFPNNIPSECPGAEFIGFEHVDQLVKYSLSEFWEMEWGDWPESTNYRNISFVGSDFVYRNVFQLRRHKLMLMKQIIDRVPRNVKIVRLHELERSPKSFVQNLVIEFNLTLKQDHNLRPPSQRIHTEKCLSESEWKIAQREIDWRVESHFGYNYLDCHLCYGASGGAAEGEMQNKGNKRQLQQPNRQKKEEDNRQRPNRRKKAENNRQQPKLQKKGEK